MAKTSLYSKKSSHRRPGWSPIWKTEAGQQIRIDKLSDQHLQNILEFILRKATLRIIEYSIEYAANSNLMHPLTIPFAAHLTNSWSLLEREAKKRKLKIPKYPTQKELGAIVDDHLLLHGLLND